MAQTTKYIDQLHLLHPMSERHLDSLKAIGERCEDNQKGFVRAEIRGYLTALDDAGIISDSAFECLYFYCTSFMHKEA